MSWVFEFHRQDGRSFKFDRMNPNITDLAMVLAGLKPLLYSHVAQDEVVWIRSLLDFFDLEYQLKRRKNPGSNNAWDLFAGLKGAPLKRAVELSRAGKVREPDLEWSALLGYPSCCTRAFAKNFKGSDPGRDVVPFIYKQTTRKTALPFYLNNIFNYSTRLNGTKKEAQLSRQLAAVNEDGASLYMLHVLPWHPCGYHCAESLRIAQKAWAFMDSLLPDFAGRMRAVLSKPVLYFDKWRFFLLDGKCEDAKTCFYTSLSSSRGLVPPEWEALLSRGDSLRLTKEGVKIGKGGKNVGVIASREAILLSFCES